MPKDGANTLLSQAEAAAKASSADEGSFGVTSQGQSQPVKHLMVKMKLLPYKLRTFLIRNGLQKLLGRDGGQQEYKEYCSRMLKSWGTSPRKTKEMVKLCTAW
jgi:hypothetical protein